MKILITGATNGIGKGVAMVLAKKEVEEVIMLCRSENLAKITKEELDEGNSKTRVSYYLCDLSKSREVKEVIEKIKHDHHYLDGMFINAGIGYAPKKIETEDKLDMHFQVNYLSQFMLTLNLLELLEASNKGGRVIFNVSEFGEINWDDLQMKTKWNYEKAIHQGMVCRRMFMQRLHRLYNKSETNVSFICFQVPKTVWTNQVNIIPKPMKLIASVAKTFGQFISIEEAGEIIAPLFLEDKADISKKSGKFLTFKNRAFIEIRENEKVLDENLQDKLWNISIDLLKDNIT